jgi:L-rhamnonate dehydratase
MEEFLQQRLVRIDKAILHGKRPRSIGYNARIPTHGPRLNDTVVRLYAEDGTWGLGWSPLNEEQARLLLGRPLHELFRLPDGSSQDGHIVDLPLWDLVARLMELPLFRLLGARGKRRVELYDASIYIDDLELDDSQAADLLTAEVESGLEHGYRNFKLKVGRGARWMEPAAGLARDALAVRSVRRAAGPQAKVMIDANMGNTLNSAIALLEACADENIHWFEEPFAEDRPLNQALKDYITESGRDTLVADGEFAPPPYFFDLVEAGLIDVVQHDFRFLGLTWWHDRAARLERWGDIQCAPHTWGSYIERYHHAHFAASIPNYAMLEASPAYMPGLIDDDWKTEDGFLVVPETPGAGFDVESMVFERGLEDQEGFCLSI